MDETSGSTRDEIPEEKSPNLSESWEKKRAVKIKWGRKIHLIEILLFAISISTGIIVEKWIQTLNWSWLFYWMFLGFVASSGLNYYRTQISLKTLEWAQEIFIEIVPLNKNQRALERLKKFSESLEDEE